MNEVMFDTIVEIVKREVKGAATPDEVMYLQSEVGLTQWREALASAISDISEQFVDKKERLESLGKQFQLGLISKDEFHEMADEINEWKRKASRYKIGLENRMHQINGKEREKNVQATEVKWKFEEVIKAVEIHKSKKVRPGAVDKELWEAVGRLVTKG